MNAILIFVTYRIKLPKTNLEGRVNHWVTAANAGSYVAWHSIAVSKENHRPALSKYSIGSLFGIAVDWYQTVHENDPEACYPFLGWNKGPRAGESIPHDHVQLLMRKKPSAKLGLMRERMADHLWLNKESYFRNLIHCLEPLGLVCRVNSATIIFHLTPIQEKEVIIYQEDPRGLPHYDLAMATYEMLRWWESVGVTDYNLALYVPPLGANLKEGDWCDFYSHVRMTDRVSNMAVMELYDTPVVSGDPFSLAKSFKEFYSTSR